MPELTRELPEIIIDDEFRNLLPALPKKTFDLLEENLLEHGCLHPLVLWGNILIDGHNRYEIAMKHSIPFNVVAKEFDSRNDVIIWIITTQVARRNLNAKQLSYYRGLHYKTEKYSIKNKNGKNQHNVVLDQNDPKPPGENTAHRLAKFYNVSAPTIKRDEKFADAINAIGENSPEAKRNILSGATDITRKHLRELMSGEDDVIIDTAKKIEEGTFERPKPVRTVASVSDIYDTPGGQGFHDTSNDPGASNNSGASDTLNDTSAGIHPLNATIIKATDDFSTVLRNLTYDADDSHLKSALRTHIDALERLYGQL